MSSTEKLKFTVGLWDIPYTLFPIIILMLLPWKPKLSHSLALYTSQASQPMPVLEHFSFVPPTLFFPSDLLSFQCFSPEQSSPSAFHPAPKLPYSLCYSHGTHDITLDIWFFRHLCLTKPLLKVKISSYQTRTPPLGTSPMARGEQSHESQVYLLIEILQLRSNFKD